MQATVGDERDWKRRGVLLTTPGVWQPGFGVPFLSPMPGQFLAKDLTLFAVSIWTAGEALRAARR